MFFLAFSNLAVIWWMVLTKDDNLVTFMLLKSGLQETETAAILIQKYMFRIISDGRWML